MAKFPESKLAHELLDGLTGIEIGGSAHNPFGLNTKNVDYCGNMDTVFKEAERRICGEALPVDIIAEGDNLPLSDHSVDFVISSHVIEHFFDPINSIKEWRRVVRPGGYIYIICPLKEFVPDETRPITSLTELIDRHEGRMKPHDVLMHTGDITKSYDIPVKEILQSERGHFTVFDMGLLVNVCQYLKMKIVALQNFDDKAGNGFTVVVKL